MSWGTDLKGGKGQFVKDTRKKEGVALPWSRRGPVGRGRQLH